jgi:hypothetical protein
MDRSSTSYLLATLAKDMATTVVVACSSKEEEEIGTNPCELAISQGERVQGSGTEFLLDVLCPT